MPRWTLTRRTLHDLRTAARLAQARPAYAAGVRAAIATITPLIFQPWLPASASAWLSLAGLNGALMDRGGPYRTRALTLGVLAFASAAAGFLGSLVAGHLVLAVAVTFGLAVACGLARAWTDVGPGFGITVLVTFAISLAVSSTGLAAGAERAGFILAGGAWAMLIAVVLWPIRPYRPVRLRIAECYRAIGGYVDAASGEIARHASHDPRNFTVHVVTVRDALEAARTALATSRRGRGSETGRGERLLVLHEIADQLLAHVIALLEESEALPTTAPQSAAHTRLAHILRGLAATVRAIAVGIESERDLPRVQVPWNGASVRGYSATMAEIVERIRDYAVNASALLAALNSGDAKQAERDTVDVVEPPAEPVLFSLTAILRPDSVVLHHALRVAIVTSVAVLLTGLLKLNHGYWVTLTAVVILQPYAAGTRQKAIQRVIGTILGGMVAAGLSALFHSAAAVLALVALFTFLCVALLPLNYGAYAVFGTPAFVLLAEAGVGDWHLAGTRILNTLLGGALALVGSRFWPGDEWRRLPDFAAAAIDANAAFLARALQFVGDVGPGDLGDLRDVRRDVARAALNAEESFQRLISEHRGRADALEPIMALLVYVRRIAASTAALAVVARSGGSSPGDVAPFAHATHEILADLSDAVRHSRRPAPFPAMGSIAMPDPAISPVIYRRLTRLSRQVKLIHDAVVRWMGGTAEDIVPR